MKNIFRVSIFVLAIILSQSASAWVAINNVTIKHLVTYEESVQKMVVLFGNDTGTLQCYVPIIEKNLSAMVLSAFMSNKSLTVHCHNSEEDVGGYPSYKLHRMIIHQ